MGWAAKDGPTKQALEIQLSRTRTEMYKLKQLSRSVIHKEKREALLEVLEPEDRGLDTFERLLVR
jgi:hypothetical protein